MCSQAFKPWASGDGTVLISLLASFAVWHFFFTLSQYHHPLNLLSQHMFGTGYLLSF